MQLSSPVNGTIDRELNLSIIDISNFDTAPLFDSVSAMIPSNSTKKLYLREKFCVCRNNKPRSAKYFKYLFFEMSIRYRNFEESSSIEYKYILVRFERFVPLLFILKYTRHVYRKLYFSLKERHKRAPVSFYSTSS